MSETKPPELSTDDRPIWERIAELSERLPPEMLKPLRTSCPCCWGEPCDERCTCVHFGSSTGCRRCCTYGSDKQREAMASAIRLQEEQAAAYRNVMQELCRLPELNTSNYDSDQVEKLNTGVNNLVLAEIAANRFVP